jgi:hypothetical protein
MATKVRKLLVLIAVLRGRLSQVAVRLLWGENRKLSCAEIAKLPLSLSLSLFLFSFAPLACHASSVFLMQGIMQCCVLGVCRLMVCLLQCYTQVSNRRSRKWLNDRLLIELVPRLHVEEIKGLFAPPPWGKLQRQLEKL